MPTLNGACPGCGQTLTLEVTVRTAPRPGLQTRGGRPQKGREQGPPLPGLEVRQQRVRPKRQVRRVPLADGGSRRVDWTNTGPPGGFPPSVRRAPSRERRGTTREDHSPHRQRGDVTPGGP